MLHRPITFQALQKMKRNSLFVLGTAGVLICIVLFYQLLFNYFDPTPGVDSFGNPTHPLGVFIGLGSAISILGVVIAFVIEISD